MPFMGNDFVIKRSLDTDCLELYPQEKFDEMMKMVMSHPNKGKDFRIWLRKFTAGLKDDVAIDKESGRMQIPKNLFDHIGLGKEVVLNAAHTMIEIWDKSKYEEMLGSMSDERYDEISEEIFNGGGQILP
ncbi:hypothetical protein GCM10011414_23700 [Croceivirga lutea]|nr:hypothetical protein GCM10011414_23700 [Croceivirga lutea]